MKADSTNASNTTGTSAEPKCRRVWVFDYNRRVYRQDEQGRSLHGSPIWREHWREEEVVGETSRSWITRLGRKIPKSGGPGIAFSEEEIERAEYVHENRHLIADQVRMLTDHDKLCQIAKIIGCKPRGE